MTDGYKIKRVLTWVNGVEKQIYPAENGIVFDFQNDGLQGGSLDYNSSACVAGCNSNGFYAYNKSSSYASAIFYIPPSSVYDGKTLKNIKIYCYMPDSHTAFQIFKPYGISLRYRQENNSTNIGFADGGSGAYGIGNLTGEMLIDVNFETGKVSGTCGGVDFTINSSNADTIMGYWTEGTLRIGMSLFYNTATAYIRKVIIKTE